jgi:hypothetical protein
MTTGVAYLIGGSALMAQDSRLEDIRSAWSARTESVPKLTCVWVKDSGPEPLPNGAPPDTEDPAFRETLFLRGDQLRYEWSHRYYDIDGGPRGSQSWQTGTKFLSWTPDHGWRGLIASSLPVARPSAYVGRPVHMAFEGLGRERLLVFWFRGLNDALTGVSFAKWVVTDDSRFVSANPAEVVLVQETPLREWVTLTLDSSLGYLPVRCTSGPVLRPSDPQVNYTEWTVQFRKSETGDSRVVPVSWTGQEIRNGQLARRPVNFIVQQIQFECARTDAEMVVQFPDGIEPSDESRSPPFAPFAPLPDAVVATENVSQKHPVHWGYWMAVGFAGLLLFALAQKVRNRMSS